MKEQDQCSIEHTWLKMLHLLAAESGTELSKSPALKYVSNKIMPQELLCEISLATDLP